MPFKLHGECDGLAAGCGTHLLGTQATPLGDPPPFSPSDLVSPLTSGIVGFLS